MGMTRPDRQKLNALNWRAVVACLLAMVLLVAMSLLTSCTNYEKSLKERAKKARDISRPVTIGVIWPLERKNFFMQGVKMAVEEINASGGVLGRQVKMEIFDDASSSGKLARSVSKDDEIVAIIGHYSSSNSLSATVSYEYNGILYIVPNATNPVITGHNFEFTFRTIPSDKEYGYAMAEYLHKLGKKKISVVYVRNIYGEGLANAFMEKAADMEMEIGVVATYAPNQETFKYLSAKLRKDPVDAIFLAGSAPLAAHVINDMREMGITSLIVGGDGLDRVEIIEISGKKAEGVIVPTIFNENSTVPKTTEFIRKFRDKYGKMPDSQGVQGYDSVMLLAEAYKRSGSVEPLVAATAIRFMDGWEGVSGMYRFGLNGQVLEKPIYYKECRNGKFEVLDIPPAVIIESNDKR